MIKIHCQQPNLVGKGQITESFDLNEMGEMEQIKKSN
jgi:hypothetical protein